MQANPPEECPTGYRFGIELEYLMRPNHFDELPQNRDSARDHLVKQWNEKLKDKLGFIPMESEYPTSSVDLKTQYAKWRLVNESLLNNDKSDVKKCKSARETQRGEIDIYFACFLT
jgi:hypothetical protein